MGYGWGFSGSRLGWHIDKTTPILLSPHGMLNSWHLKQRGFKALRKLIYWRTVAYPAFRHIPLIDAVTPRERDELGAWFPGQGL